MSVGASRMSVRLLSTRSPYANLGLQSKLNYMRWIEAEDY